MFPNETARATARPAEEMDEQGRAARGLARPFTRGPEWDETTAGYDEDETDDDTLDDDDDDEFEDDDEFDDDDDDDEEEEEFEADD